jgi:hypothetical protein
MDRRAFLALGLAALPALAGGRATGLGGRRTTIHHRRAAGRSPS